MQALGLIETIGLVVAVESADAMLKAADVTLLEKTFVGGGLVSIAVTGEVAAVKAAVDAGAAAVRQINSGLLVSQHVIPRPHEELDDVMVSVTMLKNIQVETVEPVKPEPKKDVIKEEKVVSVEIDGEVLSKTVVDKKMKTAGLEATIEMLNKEKVTKLRNLSRQYKDFGIAGRLISKADKKMLLTEFSRYYSKK